MHHRFRICCVTALIVSFFVLSATADIPKGEYAAIVAARNAEKEALLAESPYVRLRDDLFARYVRDPQVVPNEGDLVIGPRWVIVQPKLDDPVAVKMGAMLARFLKEVMGLELPVVKKVPTDRATDGLILLKTQGGGQEGVLELVKV